MKKQTKLGLNKFIISKIGSNMNRIYGGSQTTITITVTVSTITTTGDQTDDPLSDSSYDCTGTHNEGGNN